MKDLAATPRRQELCTERCGERVIAENFTRWLRALLTRVGVIALLTTVSPIRAATLTDSLIGLLAIRGECR